MNGRLIALTLILILAAGQPAAAAPVSVTRDDQREAAARRNGVHQVQVHQRA